MYFPDLVCSICGIAEEDTQWGSLIDFHVIAADGEEGLADIFMFVCDENGCFDKISDGLKALGFKDHHHGGIDFLEDRDCPGERASGVCPTPTYGRVVIGNPHLNEE